MSKRKVMTPEELRKMQTIQFEMLCDFDRVCRENDIKYNIDSGTALGAARHRKFIPWDDDIDVRMIRSEYEKFCLVADQLDETIFFQNYKTDKNYPWFYAKLRRKGTHAIRVGQEHLKMMNGVFVDIFVSDGVPSNRLFKCFRTIVGFCCRKILYSRLAKGSASNCIKRFLWGILSLVPRCIAYRGLEFLSRIFNETNCNRFGCLGWHSRFENNGYQKKWLTELQEIEFEGKNFFAPKDLHGFLSYGYGENYIIPPPVELQNGTSPLSDYYLGE